MEVLTQNRLTRNAYRILGLGGDASQEAIDQAARKMRLWANARRIPGTSWDLPWLPELQRSKSDIEQAVAALADPPTRLRERLLWFCGAPELFAAGDLHSVRENLAHAAGESAPQHEHNAAVAELAAAMFQPQPIHPGSWESVLNNFKRLSDSQDQLQWQVQLEEQGRFEKRASEQEIADVQRAMPREIATSLGRHIESALEDDNVEEASSFLSILRSVGGKTDQRILDRLEEVLERRCHNIADDLRAGVRGDHPPQHNAPVARLTSRDFEKSILPLRRDLEKLADNQPERIKRIRWHCARVLSMIGTAWSWSEEFTKAEETLKQALSLAQSSAQEEDIRADLSANEARAAEHHRRHTMMANVQSGYTMSVSNGGGFAPAGPGTVRYTPVAPQPKPGISRHTFPPPSAQPKSASGGGKWAAVVLGVLIVRLLSALLGNSSSSSSSNSPGYNFPDRSRSYYRPSDQPPLIPPPSQTESAENLRNWLFKQKQSSQSTDPPAPTLTDQRIKETGKYFNWSPINTDQSAPETKTPAQSGYRDRVSAVSKDPPTSKLSDQRIKDTSKYFNVNPSPALPQPSPSQAIQFKSSNPYPEPPSRKPSQWITAENAGLSSDPPSNTGQVPLPLK